MKSLFLSAFFFLLLSLSYMNFKYASQDGEKSLRNPAADNRVHSPNQLIILLQEMSFRFKEDLENTGQCTLLSRSYHQEISSLRGSKMEMDLLDQENLKELSAQGFLARLSLTEKLKNFNLQSPSGKKCLREAQKLFAGLRYLEDYLTEIDMISKGQDSDPEKYKSLEGSGLHFQKNPKFSYFESHKDLKSGDIILNRGLAFSSSALSRTLENENQFSHLSLVHKDEKGEIFVLESHPETGVRLSTIQEFLEQKNVRSLVYRYQDSVMAEIASKSFFEKVKKLEVENEEILYDFAMNDEDSKEIFSAELVHVAFKEASKGAIDLPLYKGKPLKNLLPFLKEFGLLIDEETYKNFHTISLSSLQFDPRLELVVEWKNPAQIKDSRVKDLILLKIFEWMETRAYQFNPDLLMKFKGSISWFMRRVPLLSLKYEKKFPLNLKSKQLNLLMGLEELGEKIQFKVDELTAQALSPFSPVEILELIENYRLEDEEKYQNFKNFKRAIHPTTGQLLENSPSTYLHKNRPEFHLMFHP